MPTISETAKYVRSKNAGPFWVTIDIFCDNQESFDLIAGSEAVTEELFASLYEVNASDVKIFRIEDLKVIKISLPRKVPQGHKYENDMHSGQQYVKLLDIQI